MRVEFDEFFRLPVADVDRYFRTPADWTELYGLAASTEDRGDGWFAVGLARFPFPLVAKNTYREPNRCTRWVFRGFWRGRGEVHLTPEADGVRVRGFEEISIRWLFGLSRLVERGFMRREFERIWSVGWHRLRKRAEAAPAVDAAGP